jgi:hypothetical protein
MKINVIDENHTTHDLVIEKAKIKTILEESGHSELSENNFVEEETMLIV